MRSLEVCSAGWWMSRCISIWSRPGVCFLTSRPTNVSRSYPIRSTISTSFRVLLGPPKGVFARTFTHPSSDLADTRTTAILDYGGDLRVALSINHHHDFGRKFQDASFRFEGDEGVAVVKLGLLLDYPRGEPDELWIGRKGEAPEQVPLNGRWFPDAFIGVMSNLQRFAASEDSILETSVESAWRTMALVEACYRSSSISGELVAELPPT